MFIGVSILLTPRHVMVEGNRRLVEPYSRLAVDLFQVPTDFIPDVDSCIVQDAAINPSLPFST
jgi:hypothetical protein